MVTNVALSNYISASGELRKPRVPEPARPQDNATPTVANPGKLPAATASDGAPPIPALDAQAFESAVKDISDKVQNFQRSLQFHVDEESGRTIITVIDKETEEVIRQIPPEEVLTLAEQFRRGGGLFVETEA
jgi:flagellar protein FlaG